MPIWAFSDEVVSPLAHTSFSPIFLDNDYILWFKVCHVSRRPGAMPTDMLASTGDKFRLPGCVRDTVITHSRLAWRHERAQAAVKSRHGLQALPIEGLAARLAGGFLQPIDPDALKAAVTKALSADLGDLDRIKELPGFPRAAAATLSKAWTAGLNLAGIPCEDDAARSRLESMA